MKIEDGIWNIWKVNFRKCVFFRYSIHSNMCVNISINVFTWPWNATGERPEPTAHWNQLRERGFWGKLRGSWGPLQAVGQIIWNLIPPNRHEDNRWLYMGYHLWGLLMVCDNTLTDLWSLTEKHMSSFLAYTCSIGRSKVTEDLEFLL